jgi:tetratricopeptide (TPR) repeat protein
MNLESWRHFARARFFEIVRRPERALEEYRAAVAIDPRLVKGWAHSAYILAQQGRFEEAERHLLEALTIAPGDFGILFNLGYVRNELKKHAKAVEAFTEVVKLKPVFDTAWYGMGLAHAALGEHPAAVAAFDQAARLQPMASPVWYQLGMACHHAREPERVHAIIHHLNRFDPKTARQLILDTGSTDLAYLVKDLVV